MNACTIIARNYLAYARVLAESLLEHHPGSSITALIVDADDGLSGTDGKLRTMAPSEIGIERDEFLRMAAVYDVLELSTAVKPWFLTRLLRDSDQVVYFDPDIEIFAPLDDLADLAREHGIVLTPHRTRPTQYDPKAVAQNAIRLGGTFNLGFLALGGQTGPLLEWWSQRVKRDCTVSPERGIFVDQRWFDIVPALFDHVVVRDPTLNVAWWNLDSREFRETPEGYEVNGRPLRFFHFSGFDPRRRHLLSKHMGPEPEILLSEHPELQRLCAAYARRLEAHGFTACVKQSYAFDRTGDVPFDRRMRRLYRAALLDAETEGSPEPPNPFINSEAFVLWLREPLDPIGQAKRISRYLRAVYEERPDLLKAFPDLRWRDGDRFLEWVCSHGRIEERIPNELIPSQRDGASPIREEDPTVEKGINLVGYLRAESGVGEAGRQLAKAVRHAGLPYTTKTYGATFSRQEHRDDEGREDSLLPYDTNIICVNADQLPAFAYDAGPDFFAGRYSVGVWWWEVADFPLTMHGAFDIVDEVWVGSEHVAKGVSAKTSKPVLTFPLPLDVPETPQSDRAALRLPADRFVFLFAFDFFSVFERKNPLGLVAAFARAFEPDEGPLLLIKSINGDRYLTQLEQLRAAIADRPDIELRDGYVSSSEMRALMSTCDAYASLHRSEGFGLTMAEAMAYGRPVVATGYSGNLTFMTERNSFLVPYELTGIPEMCDPYPAGGEWAAPDIEAAAALLRYVHEHPEEAQLRGARGKRDLRERHSLDRTAAFVSERLEEIRTRHRPPPAEPTAPPTVTARETAERYLKEGPSIPIRAPSRFGGFGVFARRLLYRFLRPYMTRQREFELAIVHGLKELEQLVDSAQGSVRHTAEEATRTAREALHSAGEATSAYREILPQLEAVQARAGELGTRLESNQGRLGEHEAGLAEAQAAAQQLEARLYAPPYTADSELLLTSDDEGRPAIGYRNEPAPGPVYLGFENVFRGSEHLIRDRQRGYVEILARHAPVLDVGCGRGELLEVLAEAGVESRGIDLDPAMVSHAREKGVEVEEAEALEYLESQAAESLGAVVAIQVIEHLPYEALLQFFELAHARLVHGGVLLVETVNPHSLEAFKTFWVDPTHKIPIFPEVAVTLCRLHGFDSAVVTFPNGSGELERDRREQGEYAVLATKSAR